MSAIEQGHTGRIVYARLRPNEDLVQSIEKLCLAHGFTRAMVRGSLGSLTQASLERAGAAIADLPGPAVEILTLAGEVALDDAGAAVARLNGTVVDPAGAVHAGRFVSGRNPVCMTFEAVLEEWVPESQA
ncbi:PCC domain-containing protein [Bordetella genomosp. 9]|uniref:DNA-binding protein n=1 Tax=Bordetella genomosp. 9 TaxID=1416803 RepID=A0A1W6Z2R8_9BORD|nr:PPC domain-containing DNA-binding protein [Bordetella genomosp. 9]ARP87409.1 DNA-binding protein [Bordetella genomosp. 9]ARP91389.1 DNA-binding protein [Bordetella genomosp. 9]